MVRTAIAFRQGLRMDPGDGRFAGRVDIGDHQHVGILERGEELVVQVEGAAVPVRLERDDQAAAEAAASGRERGTDLRRVVPVVVDHEHPPGLALDLEAALDAREAGERPLDRRERHLQVQGHRGGGERVGDVVGARHLERKLARATRPDGAPRSAP